MTLHLYQVGETVTLARRYVGGDLSSSATYTIARLLPELGTELQYRIKGEHERFERVVGEHQISALHAAERDQGTDR